MSAAVSLIGKDPAMDSGRKHTDIRFYGELEMLASLGRSVEIVFRSENGGRTVIRDRIAGLTVLEDRECLKTAAGLVIGLDKLEEVDGIRPPAAC